MVSFQRLFVPLLLILLFTGCQFPLASKGSHNKGVQITFAVTQPHQRSLGEARLILPTAQTLQVTLTRDTTTVDTQTLTLAGGTATYTAEFEVRVPHTITAKAFDASGALVFQGTSDVVLFGDRALTLYLLPVKADGSAWASVAASAQPLSGTFGPQATPAFGTSLTYLVDFGTTGSSFTFSPLASGLDLWVQRLDGSLVDPVPSTLTPADLGGDTAFWATYHQKGSNPVGTVGSFVIPLVSLTLPATYDIGLGATVDLSTLLVKTPANATDGTVEWTVDDNTVATIGFSDGQLTAGSPASTPATATVTVVQAGGAFPATLTLTVHGPEFSRLTGLTALVDGVDQGLPFVQANLSYALPTASSQGLTQTLDLTANEGEVGQTLEWSTDGTIWTPMTNAVASAITLVQGANDVRVRVTAPNGIDTNTYHVTVSKTVLPTGLTLAPATFSEATDAAAAVLFTPTFSLPETDNKTVNWSVSPPGLATIDAAGLVTPLLPGVVTVTATSNADPLVTATATLTLTPSQYLLKATSGAFWTELTSTPVKAPIGTVAIAGNDASLWALGPAGTLKVFNGGVWTTSPLTAPAGTQWFAVDNKGMVVCATTTRVYYYDTGFWSSAIPVPPVGIQGLVVGDKGVIVWGTDGGLWSYEGALWTKLAIALPAGTTAVVGGSGLVALVGTQVKEFQSGIWSPMPVSALPQTVSSAFALGQFVSLIVR